MADSQIEQSLPITEQKPKFPSEFQPLLNVSLDFSGRIKKALIEGGVDPNIYGLKTTINIAEKSPSISAELKSKLQTANTWEEFIELCRISKLKIAEYWGGINWRGDPRHPREISPKSTGLTGRMLDLSKDKVHSASIEPLLPTEKSAEEKASALDFMKEIADIVITIDPVLDTPLNISSLKADAIASRVISKEISENIPPEDYKRICWSDGGFKQFMLQISAFGCILDDIRYAREHGMLHYDQVKEFFNPDTNQIIDGTSSILENILLKVKVARQNEKSPGMPNKEDAQKRAHLWQKPYDCGYDALQVIKYLKNTDTIIAGAPANYKELGFPFKGTGDNLPIQIINNTLRTITNKQIAKGGKNESHPALEWLLYNVLPLSTGDRMLFTRILELGRSDFSSKEFQKEFQNEESSFLLASFLMNNALGDGRIVFLSDPSGKVVTSYNGEVGIGLSMIYGPKTIFVETREEIPLKKGIFDESRRILAEHDEIKRPGTLGVMEGIIAASKLGLICQSPPENTKYEARYAPVGLTVQRRTKTGALQRKEKDFNPARFNVMKNFEKDPDTNLPLSDKQKSLLKKVEHPFKQGLSYVVVIPEKPLKNGDYLRMFIQGIVFGPGWFGPETQYFPPSVPAELSPPGN